jgi:hypothetical protein
MKIDHIGLAICLLCSVLAFIFTYKTILRKQLFLGILCLSLGIVSLIDSIVIYKGNSNYYSILSYATAVILILNLVRIIMERKSNKIKQCK